jgi:hypothetical protein
MKEPEMTNKVLQTLKEFESMENISPSAEWNRLLMDKLSSEKLYSASTFKSLKFAVAVFLIVLINISFIMISIFSDSNKSFQRKDDLQIISKEFLIEKVGGDN